MAQSSDFHVPIPFADFIRLFKDGYSILKTWKDYKLTKMNQWWDKLYIFPGYQIRSFWTQFGVNPFGVERPMPQPMAAIEVDPVLDEYQAWL